MSKEFRKSYWSVNDNNVRLGMEINKVDKNRRMVTGWATVDNVDQEGDQVTAEASLDAFARSRMNLREMHRKDSAVGRIVSFKQDTFRAPDGKEYKGIFVKVYVSKGAEDTWQKVLDKTLNGFSIGGDIVDFEDSGLQKSNGEKGKRVTKYNLNELSLVDNPGNEYSDFTNVFKIRNNGSVTSVTGLIEDHKVLNVYYCNEDGITKEVPGEAVDCPVCGEEMEYVGIVEDNADRGSEVGAMVQKFISSEGGAQMTKINKSVVGPDDLESEATGHEAGDEAEVPTPVDSDVVGEDVDEVEEEKTDEVDEVEDEGREISKAIDNLKNDIEAILHDSTKKTAEKIAELEKSVTTTRNFFEQKISDLDKKFEEVSTNLEAQKARISTFEKVLNKVNSRSALRKSADSVEPVEEQDNSAWNGAFSVKNLVG